MFFGPIVFIAVLGILIFFHELGHFVAAKLCGVFVDRFSLGMPPRIFGVKVGETDYCIGALPIGGYVKMAGQEDVPLSEEERTADYGEVPPDRWLSSKPLWQRALVFAAGPLMNLVLAVLLYSLLGLMGADVPETKLDNRIGAIHPDSPASTARLYLVGTDGEVDFGKDPDAEGWKTGDRVVSVDGQSVGNISDLAINAILSGGSVVTATLERTDANGQIQRYLSQLEPRVLDGDGNPRFGVEPFYSALVGGVEPGDPADAAGLKPGDIITRLNGEPIDQVTFRERVTKMTNGEPLNLNVSRGDESMDITLTPKIIGRFPGVIFTPAPATDAPAAPTTPPEVLATDYPPANDGEAPRLLRGDIILEVDGKPATAAALAAFEDEGPGRTVAMKVRRPAIWMGILRPPSEIVVELPLEATGIIGIAWDTKMILWREPLSGVLPYAFKESWLALDRTATILAKLVTGQVSPRGLGGPILIYRATTGAARMGLSWLLEITAFISVNLCLFNLLPLPVLDGGHLVFLGIEGIRRKPVNMKVASVVQQIGLAFIVALMLFVLFNDFRTLIQDMVP